MYRDLETRKLYNHLIRGESLDDPWHTEEDFESEEAVVESMDRLAAFDAPDVSDEAFDAAWDDITEALGIKNVDLSTSPGSTEAPSG